MTPDNRTTPDDERAGDEGADHERLARLLPGAVGGDRRAVEQLLAHIRPLVTRYCRARIGRAGRSTARPEDVADETCRAVLRALPSYRDQGRPFLAFVYGIAAHKVADAGRGRARDDEEEDEPQTGSAEVRRLLGASSLGRPAAVAARERGAGHRLGAAAAVVVDGVLRGSGTARHRAPAETGVAAREDPCPAG
ncbi:sigma factor [Saccharothrix sp. Mg75]|uniref:sigma factor n=1 Tax=Saccharothrix sp. Mg75 TaxID=3445357 RepID=UPI003EE95385